MRVTSAVTFKLSCNPHHASSSLIVSVMNFHRVPALYVGAECHAPSDYVDRATAKATPLPQSILSSVFIVLCYTASSSREHKNIQRKKPKRQFWKCLSHFTPPPHILPAKPPLKQPNGLYLNCVVPEAKEAARWQTNDQHKTEKKKQSITGLPSEATNIYGAGQSCFNSFQGFRSLRHSKAWKRITKIPHFLPPLLPRYVPSRTGIMYLTFLHTTGLQ